MQKPLIIGFMMKIIEWIKNHEKSIENEKPVNLQERSFQLHYLFETSNESEEEEEEEDVTIL